METKHNRSLKQRAKDEERARRNKEAMFRRMAEKNKMTKKLTDFTQ